MGPGNITCVLWSFEHLVVFLRYRKTLRMSGYFVWVKVFLYNDLPCVKENPVFVLVIMEKKDFDDYGDIILLIFRTFWSDISPVGLFPMVVI